MIKTPAASPQELIKRVEKGVPFRDLEVLGRKLHLTLDELSRLVGIARATLHRRRKEGRLQPMESDRLVRYERLLAQAIKVFESEEDALGWLRAAQRGLGGAVPLEYAQTEVGAREVERLLGRIEYGVYS
ncbi:MAG: antitoxin Xre/MbcA/ParS toxin-binding domain-containing protein [Verrucomicrobiota bacterium]